MITSKFRAPRGRLPATAIQTGTDTWTSREKICLVEAIQSLGNEDWNEVSKYIHELTKSTRTKEWCSPLNCSRQFHCMMESVGRQLRRRGDGDKDILTALRQHFVNERVNEINILAEDSKQKFMNLFKFNKEVEAGTHDDRVGEILTAYGTEATLEQDQQQPQEEENSGFYFAELADLNEKVSLINQFIQEQIGISSQPKEEEKLPEAAGVSASTTLGDEDEDLADLADIFPDMETFNPEDLDETLIENTEFEMMSPPDSTPTSRKAPPTSPKVSPQLKNLVRTAIAGTSEDDRPRNLTPSAGAPTLSMLLEMPPRDPGQPLPEIGTVTKAASTALEPSRQDRVSPYKSPSAATLEQLNIALANSPTRHQDHQVKSKSSSPTLQRLLEGTMPLKKDTDDRLSAFASSFSFIPTEEIKQEVEASIASTSSDAGAAAASILSPVSSSPRKFPPEVPSITVNPTEAVVEMKPEVVEVEAQAAEPAKPTVKETEAPVEIKEEKEEEAAEVQETSALQPEEPMEVQPLPPDVQTKVNNLKDLVIIQNKGTVTPKGSPEKKDADVAGNAPTIEKQTLPAAAVSAQESAGDAEIKEEAASPDVTVESESVSMPVLQPVVELVPLSLADVKGVKIGSDKPVQLKTPAEPMDVDEAYETPPEEPIESKPRKDSTAQRGDSDEELPSRKKTIPAKTYSRKERYGEPLDIDDDSSNSGVDAAAKSRSPSRHSPGRSTRTPPKQTEVKRGRKSRVSESVAKQLELDRKEEAARVTRARSKPGTPQKAPAPKTPAVSTPTTTTSTTATTKTTPEADSEPVAPRVTRNRASTVPSQAEASVKKSTSSGEDKDVSIISDDHHSTPGRATRGRISSTTKLLDSLPAVPFESNPSSPSSSTTTSTTMMDHEDKEQRAFRKSISILWDQIKSHKHAGQFLKPITDTAVPSYSKKVLRPMDLTTIKRNIDNGMIRNIQSFERDIYLMLMNATMYNSSEHEIHQRTLQMEEDVRTMLESFKATQKALRQAQMVESLGPDPAHRSPVKLRSSVRRSQKISDSDADDVHADELHSGVHTPQSTSDHETDDTDASRTKTRESSPDITTGMGVSSGMKRRSRAAAAKAERTGSSDSKTRNQSPDVNAS